MANQLYIKENSDKKNIFPKNYTDNIRDKESNKTLTEILQGFNCYFLSYTGNVETTRLQVPKLLRKQGLWITYVDYENNTITEYYDNPSIEDSKFKDSSNWREGNNRLVGDLSISANGNWVINGVETEFKAQGEAGTTPLIRLGDNNKFQVSYNKRNRWEDISGYIEPTIRMTGASGNSIGHLELSMDKGTTWTSLSGDIVNNLKISKYIGIYDTLPTSGVKEGTIYMKGPYYDENDTNNDNPIYRMWVYAWKDNTLAWVDNGEFTSIIAGVVQETGDSEDKVMSQKVVTEKLSELELKNIYFNGFGANYSEAGSVEIGEYYYNTNRDCIVQRVGEAAWKDIPLSNNTSYYHKGDLYISDGEKLIKSTEKADIRLAAEELKSAILFSDLDKIQLEVGTISVDSGNAGDMSTRFRTRDFVAAPFSIIMNYGYLINYIYKYDTNGKYVGYESPSDAKELVKEDSSYLYKLSYRKSGNEEIVEDDLTKSLTFRGKVGIIDAEVKDANYRLSNIENAFDSVTEYGLTPMEIYSEIESSYLTADGNLANLEGFSVRLYSCENVTKIQLEGTGGGIAYRYAFYKSSDLNGANAIKVGPQMSGEPYSEIIEVPKGATFFAVTYRTIWQQQVSSLVRQIKASKTSLKILCFGNSFTLGSMGYAPFLLKDHFKEDIDLTIGIAFISGGTLGPTWEGVENQLQKITEDTPYTYWKYVNGAQSWINSSAKPSEMLADEDWDVVTFQQGSNNAPDYATYQPYLNECIDLISQKVSKPIKIAWLIPHADTNVFTQGKEQGILDSAERVMDETITEVLIPYGTAIANARTTSLKEIGDAGNILYEGKHLQNGLPMLVSNYCSMIVLLNLLGMNQKSIVGINSIEVNDAWVSAHNIPNAGAVGNCVGVTSENCRIAEKCAIMAVKKPYTIMDM